MYICVSYLIHTDVVVRFTSNADDTIVHKNQGANITVNVTVFGSLSGSTILVLHYGEGGPPVNMSIERTSGTQSLQITTTDRLNCTTPLINVTVATDDPLVELQGNRVISIHIGKKTSH